MEVVIFGQKWLASQVLELCQRQGYKVIGAVTNSGSFANTANRLNIPIFVMNEAPKADLALAAHCHDYIPPKVLSRYGKGVIGYHPSILPDYKGKNAVEDAIKNRETITGGSLYYLDEGLDTGDIILQDWCMIHPHDTPSALWRESLAPMGLRLFERILNDIKAGKPLPIKKQKQ